LFTYRDRTPDVHFRHARAAQAHDALPDVFQLRAWVSLLLLVLLLLLLSATVARLFNVAINSLSISPCSSCSCACHVSRMHIKISCRCVLWAHLVLVLTLQRSWAKGDCLTLLTLLLTLC
jgi:hypothetical protein